eukprot:1158411-Pelagomonas_calceolata.AAC.2
MKIQGKKGHCGGTGTLGQGALELGRGRHDLLIRGAGKAQQGHSDTWARTQGHMSTGGGTMYCSSEAGQGHRNTNPKTLSLDKHSCTTTPKLNSFSRQQQQAAAVTAATGIPRLYLLGELLQHQLQEQQPAAAAPLKTLLLGRFSYVTSSFPFQD